jgi:replicative DNA helicase
MSLELTQSPHDDTLERAVLGAILIGGSFDDVAEHLEAADWYFRKHQAIYAAMLNLRKRSEALDYLTVSQELAAQGRMDEVGGNSYLAELIAEVVSAASIKSHAKAVKELSLLRGLRRIGQELTLQAEEKKDASEIATDAEHKLFTTMWARQVLPWRTSTDVMTEALDHLEKMQQRGEQLSGITTGLLDLDKMLGGWQPSDLVVLAARPSMGKTALMCGAAIAAAKAGHPVAISSLEMSARQLGSRMLAHEAHVNIFDLVNGRLHRSALWPVGQAAQLLSNAPIKIDDSGLMTMDKLRAKARQLKVQNQIDVLFVDYLQLMEGKGRRDSRQVEVSEISRGLKLLAKELNITVVALSQLSRRCEEREDKRPILSDLRESGAIEQDADIVIGMYRDEVYYPESPDKGTAELLIRKHRNGPIGDVRVAFIDISARFTNLEFQERKTA